MCLLFYYYFVIEPAVATRRIDFTAPDRIKLFRVIVVGVDAIDEASVVVLRYVDGFGNDAALKADIHHRQRRARRWRISAAAVARASIATEHLGARVRACAVLARVVMIVCVTTK